jgi:uncharacterized RDD family membrane protein YckC
MDDVCGGDGSPAETEPEDVMTVEEAYIDQVLSKMPGTTPRRAQIALELRGHIAERLAAGHSLQEVLDQLGDPMALAESYLKSVPLVSAPLVRRAIAKIVDVAVLAAIACAWFWIGWRIFGPNGIWVLPALARAAAPILIFAFPILVMLIPGYFIAAEYLTGQTLGKWLLGISVVRESGARITLGQSFVRQLALIGQIFVIDVLFAFFSEKNQRAFEIISKTRVIRVPPAAAVPL